MVNLLSSKQSLRVRIPLLVVLYDRILYRPVVLTVFTIKRVPVWWNGIHNRLKICHRFRYIGSSPMTGSLVEL
jgi:hypothetical protein